MLLKIEGKEEKEKSYKITSNGKSYYAKKDIGAELRVGQSYDFDVAESKPYDYQGKMITSKWLNLPDRQNGTPVAQSVTVMPQNTPQNAPTQEISDHKRVNAIPSDLSELRAKAMQMAISLKKPEQNFADVISLADDIVKYLQTGVPF